MGVREENMAPLLRASIEYCQRIPGVALVVFCSKCFHPAGYDDLTDTGNWCSECVNQKDFTTFPTCFAEEWRKGVKEGKTIGEIKERLLGLIQAEIA